MLACERECGAGVLASPGCLFSIEAESLMQHVLCADALWDSADALLGCISIGGDVAVNILCPSVALATVGDLTAGLC